MKIFNNNAVQYTLGIILIYILQLPIMITMANTPYYVIYVALYVLFLVISGVEMLESIERNKNNKDCL